MTKQELESLGISLESIEQAIVDRFVNSENEFLAAFDSRVHDTIKQAINEKLDREMQTFVHPKIVEMTDSIILQETNTWGEKKGQPLTFVEYLVQRVDAYIREPVNHYGKSRAEDSYNWSASTTRIAHMIHEHLKYNIEKAMQQALGEVNSSVRKGLQDAVNLALQRVKVKVNTEVN